MIERTGDRMPTINKNLVNLTYDDVLKISDEYLKGWHDLCPKYGFRIKGFNHKREEYGLEPLTKDLSFQYRLKYVREHYTKNIIIQIITDYMETHDMDAARWSGVELFDCRFGPEWAKFMKQLIGNSLYRRLAETARVHKLTTTQMSLYGGVGLGNIAAKEKAMQTNMKLYGGTNVMCSKAVREKLAQTNLKKYKSISPFGGSDVQTKAQKSRAKVVQDAIVHFKQTGELDVSMFKQSVSEYLVFLALVDKFGVDDVIYQYGLHPYDARYPYACDFYIKSRDLFIELNGYYCHGGHWFDCNNADDISRRDNWLNSGKVRNIKAVGIWTDKDVEKRKIAKKNKLNYLVFWDGTSHRENKKNIPNLSDFKMWYDMYDCDYESFIRDFPQNTY